jgi:uncharacterized lipoprotein YajG
MKLTKFFMFLAALALFAACSKEPTQLNPGGYTGTRVKPNRLPRKT